MGGDPKTGRGRFCLNVYIIPGQRSMMHSRLRFRIGESQGVYGGVTSFPYMLGRGGGYSVLEVPQTRLDHIYIHTCMHAYLHTYITADDGRDTSVVGPRVSNSAAGVVPPVSAAPSGLRKRISIPK